MKPTRGWIRYFKQVMTGKRPDCKTQSSTGEDFW